MFTRGVRPVSFAIRRPLVLQTSQINRCSPRSHMTIQNRSYATIVDDQERPDPMRFLPIFKHLKKTAKRPNFWYHAKILQVEKERNDTHLMELLFNEMLHWKIRPQYTTHVYMMKHFLKLNQPEKAQEYYTTFEEHSYELTEEDYAFFNQQGLQVKMP
ncbi:hypothetical protein PROFUN_14129 [Planoprotostelium fungivorum]|uniref:Uncharacterized protein n=1 Tax=Planoprotostelium fungivorum TaxID=1890364 RepID=A0A2P6N1C4_9EUKA|nr:hypothetical protein PROFUN_14129 [Planoprotostelium fungivorum]